MKDDRTPIAWPVLALFLLTVIFFMYSVDLRKPWFGRLSYEGNQWLTASTLKFSRNWFNEGAKNLKFAMIENPKSIEFQTPESRSVYLSYPPGTIIPIHLISRIRHREPTVSLIMQYNLFNHFLIALSLSLTMFFFLKLELDFNSLNAFLFATIPIPLELMLPAPLYWHQNVFFADQAIILPFALIVLLEAVRSRIKNNNYVNYIQAVIMFYGFLTDWLFVFLAVFLYIKRLATGEIPLLKPKYLLLKSLRFWLMPMVALALYVYQIYVFNGFAAIYDKFLFRASMSAGGAKYLKDFSFFDLFWGHHISTGFGPKAISILWGSLILFVAAGIAVIIGKISKKELSPSTKKIVCLGLLVLAPNFVIIYVFSNHSLIHHFTSLKFSIPFSIVPFVLGPLLVLSIFRELIDRARLVTMTALIMILVSANYTINEYPNFKQLFPAPGDIGIAEFIAKNTSYQDIVFSPAFAIAEIPPQMLAISMKRVYSAPTIPVIRDSVKKLRTSYVINILAPTADTTFAPGIRRLLPLAYELRQEGAMKLYKIRKKDFFRQIERQRERRGYSDRAKS